MLPKNVRWANTILLFRLPFLISAAGDSAGDLPDEKNRLFRLALDKFANS